MKYKTTLFLTIVCILATINIAKAAKTQYQFIANDHSPSTQICVNAAGNNIKGLRVSMRRDEQNKRSVANALYCNGMLVSHFALKYGADNIAKYLNQYAFNKNRFDKAQVTIIDLAMNNKEPLVIKKIFITSRNAFSINYDHSVNSL